MTDLNALADRLTGHLGPFSFITEKEKDLVVSALRAAAQPAAPSSDVREALELRDLLLQCRGWLFYAYHNIDSVTSDKVKATLPDIDRRIAALSARSPAPSSDVREAFSEDDVRWSVNYLLEQIASKFEGYETVDIWKSIAADIVRSYKHQNLWKPDQYSSELGARLATIPANLNPGGEPIVYIAVTERQRNMIVSALSAQSPDAGQAVNFKPQTDIDVAGKSYGGTSQANQDAAPQPRPVAGREEIARRGIYIASKTKHADRWRFLRDKVGEPIISTWIDEAGEGESSDLHDLWQRCLSEASQCQVLIAYRENDEVFKGGWVEIGAALSAGVPVYAVGFEDFTIAKYRGITHFRDMKSAIKAARKALLQGAVAVEQWQHNSCDCYDDTSRKYCLRKGSCSPIAEAQSSPAPQQPGEKESEGDRMKALAGEFNRNLDEIGIKPGPSDPSSQRDDVIEECAKVADHLNGWGADCGRGGHAEHIATAIRAIKSRKIGSVV